MYLMSAKEIRDSINVTKDYQYGGWNTDNNCYAFALGLNVNEDQIGKHAFARPGIIAAHINGTDIYDVNKRSIEQGIKDDLNALKLGYSLIKNTKGFEHKYVDGHECDIWEMLFFLGEDESDFHFARYLPSGVLMNKWGYLSQPIKTTIEDISEKGYKLHRIYRVRKCYIDDSYYR